MDKLKLILSLFLLFCAIISPIIAEYLRHRSWLRHRHTGYAPGTQHIAFWGSVLSVCFLICSILVIKFL